MNRYAVLIGLTAVVVMPANALKAGQANTARQTVPAQVIERAERARIAGTITAWCQGEFRPGRRQDVAVAVTTPEGGRYVVLDSRGDVTELALFTGTPDLSCYTRAEAMRLNRDLTRSETIAGRIAPRWNTAVICGFVENTSATCWQYSPAARAFVQVGSWIT